MPDATVSLTLTGTGAAQSAALRRTATVITRALRMDTGAMVRLAAAGEDQTDLLVSTPLGCVVAERIPAVPDDPADDGAVVSADPLPGLLTAAAGAVGSDGSDGDAALPVPGPRMDMLWPGTTPPASGWTVVDTVPGGDVRDLFAGMEREADLHSGPAGLPPSLLDQPLLRLTSPTQTGIIEIPGSVIAALGALGLVTAPTRAALREYDLVRVSVTASWIRLDALYGSVYLPRPGGLARIPTAR
ncbi:hypothetical protein [Corynebacterium nuruki]|uniref:hypothetical protein n=1 Tax=Corynebacterium nuruki TaxID=1032851 RepID=UPI0039BFEA7D